MREFLAIVSAAWRTEKSYRLSMAFSLASLAFIVVPLYFVTRALQPVMASSIATEGADYFAFALLGAAAFSLVTAAVTALPNAVAAAISRGTLEAYLGTPTHPAVIFAGLGAYGLAWAFVRSAVIVVSGAILGVRLAGGSTPSVLLILALLVVAHVALGSLAGAMVIGFRTSGPFVAGVLTGSMLLGGVYYPTHVIPSWLQDVSRALPLTYGLRALRQAALQGQSFEAISRDVTMLAIYTIVLLCIAVLATAAALSYAKRSGTLSQY